MARYSGRRGGGPPALPDGLPQVPLGRPPLAVRDWFDDAAGTPE